VVVIVAIWRLQRLVSRLGGWKNVIGTLLSPSIWWLESLAHLAQLPIGHLGLALARQRRRLQLNRRPKRIVLIR
jgi:hypothetical protein